jgi:hypothetical protein
MPPSSLTTKEDELVTRARWMLLISAAVTFGLYLVPYGDYLAYPLLLISTVVHELGHGIAAVISGADFVKFEMFKDGSGYALHTDPGGGMARAFVSAGGLCGPAVAAALCFVGGRTPMWSRRLLGAFGVGLALAMVLVVRNGFGLFFIGALAAGMIAIAVWARAEISQLAIVFLGVQLALSVFSRGDYLFMKTADTAIGPMPSDSQQMAQALALPYWFWGGLCAAFSGAVLIGGSWYFLRGAKKAAAASHHLPVRTAAVRRKPA